jgi:tight adherence protein B
VNTSLAILLVFLALASAMAASAMAVRDLVFSRGASGAAKGAASATRVRLRRVPGVVETGGPAGPVSAFDRWFRRTVRDTGMSLSPMEAALLLVLCGSIGGAALFLWNERPLIGIIGVVVGMGAALVYLVIRRGKRVMVLQEQLPGALDMLARSLRAGQSLDEAFQVVGDRSPRPLAAEFRFCANQLAMGLSMPAVMRSLVDRVCLFDMRIFTTTLSVHRQTGGNVARVLERLAAVIRDRLSYRRQLRAITGAGRLSATIIATIGPLLFLYLFYFHPQYLQAMTESSVGQTLLTVAVSLEIIGLIWVARLLRPFY